MRTRGFRARDRTAASSEPRRRRALRRVRVLVLLKLLPLEASADALAAVSCVHAATWVANTSVVCCARELRLAASAVRTSNRTRFFLPNVGECLRMPREGVPGPPWPPSLEELELPTERAGLVVVP